MKIAPFFLLIFFFPFLSYAQQTLNKTLVHDGITRTYLLYVPANYTSEAPVPLIFNFHGYTSNANAQMNYGDFRSIADTAGFIVVHPQGTLFNGNTHFNVGGWTIGSTTDDVGFTSAMIDVISQDYAIDSDRIYATGMSNGGFMSFLLACQLSDKIAAIASVTGSMTPQTYNACDPKHPMPILQIHGTTDPTVPYFGAIWTKSISDIIPYWVNFNNCSDMPISGFFPNVTPEDQSVVNYLTYENGDQGVMVKHFRVVDGGHTWPGTAFGGSDTNYDIDASHEIWKFFSQYRLSDLKSTTGREIDKQDNFLVYPSPASTSLQIQIDVADFRPLTYQLNTVDGKTVQTGKIHSAYATINVSLIPSGIYLLKLGTSYHKILISH